MSRDEKSILILHMFIQFLAHHRVLDKWVDEMCNENLDRGWTIRVRSNRMVASTFKDRLILTGFGSNDSIYGGTFWRKYHIEWSNLIYPKLVKEIEKEELNPQGLTG